MLAVPSITLPRAQLRPRRHGGAVAIVLFLLATAIDVDQARLGPTIAASQMLADSAALIAVHRPAYRGNAGETTQHRVRNLIERLHAQSFAAAPLGDLQLRWFWAPTSHAADPAQGALTLTAGATLAVEITPLLGPMSCRIAGALHTAVVVRPVAPASRSCRIEAFSTATSRVGDTRRMCGIAC